MRMETLLCNVMLLASYSVHRNRRLSVYEAPTTRVPEPVSSFARCASPQINARTSYLVPVRGLSILFHSIVQRLDAVRRL